MNYRFKGCTKNLDTIDRYATIYHAQRLGACFQKAIYSSNVLWLYITLHPGKLSHWKTLGIVQKEKRLFFGPFPPPPPGDNPQQMFDRQYHMVQCTHDQDSRLGKGS